MTTAGVQTLPRTAKNLSFIAVWEDDSHTLLDPSGTAIRAQLLDGSGNRAGNEILVNTVIAGDQTDPSVAAVYSVYEGFVVAWTGSDSSGTGIKAQIFGGSGGKIGEEFQVNTTVSDNQSQARAVDVPGLGFVVVWLDHSGTGSAIRGQFYQTSGAKYGNAAGAADEILDFQPGVDRIDLSRIDTDPFSAGDQPFIWIGSNAFTGDPIFGYIGELRAYEDDGTWFVQGDMDADGIADFTIEVTTQGAAPLVQGDFLL